MHNNITISDLNVEIQGKGNSVKRHLVAKIGIGIIEFLLASVLYCYGIILSEYVSYGSHKYGEGLWTSILFICSWSFIDPISRFISEYFEDRKLIFFRYVIGITAAILFLAVMTPDNVVLYMFFGGMLSNLISTQLGYFAMDKLDMDSKIFEAIRQVARALSLFVMPHCVWWLASNPDYDINQVKLIFGSILLNIIPAALIIRTAEHLRGKRKNTEMSRYQTIGRFAYQMNEIKNFGQEDEDNKSVASSASSDEEIPIFEINPVLVPGGNSSLDNQLVSHPEDGDNQPQTTSHKQSMNYGIDNYGLSEQSVGDLEAPNMHLSSLNVQSYFFNVGVSILPGIPEENEEEETNDINYIDPKRLSRISGKLEELNILDQIRRDSIREVFSINDVINENKPEPINKIEYIPNFKEEKNRISVLDELKNLHKARHCFHCSPYRKYIWTRRLRMLKDFLNDNFLRPLYHAVKNIYFYPSLATKVVINLVSTLYITLAPFMALQKSWKQNVLFNTENVTFLLTYVAFAWCFFLVGLPLIFKLNQNKIRIVFGFGLVVSGTSLWILSGKPTNDIITISSLLFGFGHGITAYTEKIVFKTAIGMRPWYLVRGPLEVLSAILILLIYYIIYLNKFDINVLLVVAALSYYFNALLWFCLHFVKFFVNIVKRIVFDERSQQEGFFH